MSLIADALKAAQWERSGADASTRRHRAAAGLVKKPLAGPTAASRIPIPAAGMATSTRVSLGVLVVAMVAGGSLVMHGRATRLEVAAEAEGPSLSAAAGASGAAQPSQRELAQALLGGGAPPEAHASDAAAPVGTFESAGEEDESETGVQDGERAYRSFLEAPVVSAAAPGAPSLDAEGAAPSAAGPGAAAGTHAAAAAPTAAAEPAGSFRITLAPGRTEATEFRDAVAAQRRGDHRSAVSLYVRLLQRQPGHAEAANNLGTSHQALGELELARDAYRRALDHDPGYAAAWSNLAGVLALLGDGAGSRDALAESIRLDPANRAAKVNLANQYAAAGEYSAARALLTGVLRTDPGMAEAHYALARVLEATGDRPGAVQAYRSFLQTAGSRFPQLISPVRDRITQLEQGR